MRIAILAYTFPRGMGYIGNMLPRHLARLGPDVHYLTMDLPHYFQQSDQVKSYGRFEGLDVVPPGAVEQIDGFTLHGLGHRRILRQMRYVGLAQKLEKLRPDVVQSLLAIGWPALDAALLQPRLRFSLFTANHTTASVFPLAQRSSRAWEPARLRNYALRHAPGRFISRRTVRCYAATTDCADVAVRFFGVEPTKVDIAPLGVDTDRFRPVLSEADRSGRSQMRSQLGFAPQDLVFVYTGQFSAEKNPLLLVQAVQMLREQGLPARALVIGDGAQASNMREHPFAVVLPFMPNAALPDYYRSADVGVWPTQESTSMLDAAACGLPIVVNDTLRAVERIDSNGLTYRLNDCTDLARVLGGLAAPQIREQLGARGAQKMAERFSWQDIARKRLRDFEAAVAAR